MNHGVDEGNLGEDSARATSHLTAVDAALAAGDVPAALRAWHEAYGATMGSRRWEGYADAGDAYLRIARASLDGVLRLARPSSSSGTTRWSRTHCTSPAAWPARTRGPICTSASTPSTVVGGLGIVLSSALMGGAVSGGRGAGPGARIGPADVGDACLRIGHASGAPSRAVPRARDLYLSALFRARDAGSLDGVLRIAAAFDRLGDRDVTAQALGMARRLAPAS